MKLIALDSPLTINGEEVCGITVEYPPVGVLIYEEISEYTGSSPGNIIEGEVVQDDTGIEYVNLKGTALATKEKDE